MNSGEAQKGKANKYRKGKNKDINPKEENDWRKGVGRTGMESDENERKERKGEKGRDKNDK